MKKQDKISPSIRSPRFPRNSGTNVPKAEHSTTGYTDDLLCFSSACERHKINPNKDRFYAPEIAVLYGRKPNTVYYWFVRQRGPVKMYKDRRGNVFAFRHDLAQDLQDVVAG